MGRTTFRNPALAQPPVRRTAGSEPHGGLSPQALWLVDVSIGHFSETDASDGHVTGCACGDLTPQRGKQGDSDDVGCLTLFLCAKVSVPAALAPLACAISLKTQRVSYPLGVSKAGASEERRFECGTRTELGHAETLQSACCSLVSR